MRIAVTLGALALASCGPPSWPESAYPDGDGDGAVRLGTTPADPIEGETITLTLPMSFDPPCHAFDGQVRRDEREGEVLLALVDATPGVCEVLPVSGAGANVPLGTLAAGHYVIDLGTSRLELDVRPASTSPGPPPLWWRVAHEVAVRHQVGGGCGGDEHDVALVPPFSARDPRLYHQVAAAYPDWAPAQVESAMCAAQSVQVRTVSDHELRYRHSSSSLCHTSESIGTVQLHADGTFEIEPPYVVDGHDVDC